MQAYGSALSGSLSRHRDVQGSRLHSVDCMDHKVQLSSGMPVCGSSGITNDTCYGSDAS